jgi:FAD synthetase
MVVGLVPSAFAVGTYRSGTVPEFPPLAGHRFPQYISLNLKRNITSIYLRCCMSKKPVENKEKSIKVMVFGTFDGLHPGHLNFFKQARDLAADAYLIVSIARDKNVARIKGRKPKINEKKRLALLKKSALADKVVLAGEKNTMPHILKERPDIIALGYDQEAYVDDMRQEIKNRKLKIKIVRLKPYKEKIYKNSLLNRV